MSSKLPPPQTPSTDLAVLQKKIAPWPVDPDKRKRKRKRKLWREEGMAEVETSSSASRSPQDVLIKTTSSPRFNQKPRIERASRCKFPQGSAASWNSNTAMYRMHGYFPSMKHQHRRWKSREPGKKFKLGLWKACPDRIERAAHCRFTDLMPNECEDSTFSTSLVTGSNFLAKLSIQVKNFQKRLGCGSASTVGGFHPLPLVSSVIQIKIPYQEAIMLGS
ncbi:hypothetical protein B0H16DRAFT_1452581 [Mycena metata]|uniref:Uncharacterized protein n=1 Tax=Mycena metata TaxID=1033252 RepID=A0AAD7NPS9_9AGAR|nr:hypothetical protein B0H16DRAFT_1452581 [Mycena metata]